MQNKVVSIVTVTSFLAFLFAVFFMNIFRTPDEFSFAERRRLAQMPTASVATLLDGSFMRDFDDFAVDQVVFRDQFRGLKAMFDLYVLRKLDNNGIFIVDGMVFKTDYPLNEDSIVRLSGGINSIYERYLQGMNVFFTIVPDKNYHLQNSGHLIIDYSQMEAIARENVNPTIQYVSMFGDLLSLEDYYRTDTHWRQERIGDVAQFVADTFGVTLDPQPFTEHSFDSFFGVYYGQAALRMSPDTLIWLVSETTDNAVVTSVELPGETIPVYDLTQLNLVDPYSMFMGGPAAIITAINPNNDSGRELIMFRDSFASSLAPLLLDAYSKITLVDLRYIQPDLIGEFVEFTDQDVLFIYSSAIFNSSYTVRVDVAQTDARVDAAQLDVIDEIPLGFVSPFVARSRIQQAEVVR